MESSNSTWSGRYSRGDENQLDEGLRLNGESVLTKTSQWTASNTRVLSSTVVNETRFGYTKFYNSLGRELAFNRNVVDELGIAGLKGGPPVQWGIPSITLQTYSGFGDSAEGPYENTNSSLQFLNNTSWVRGKHTLRFGGEIRRDQYNQVGNQFARGSFTFSGQATKSAAPGSGGDPFADFLLGQVYQPEASVSLAEARFRAISGAVYLDDNWKITPKLTLSLGIRYEVTPPWEDETGRLLTVFLPNFDSTPQTDQSRFPIFLRQGKGNPYENLALRFPDITVVRDGRLGDRFVQIDKNDFAPRLGISYSPTPKWVFRTGAGLFCSQDTGNPRFDLARNAAGRARAQSNPDTPNLTWDNGLPTDTNIRLPYAFVNLYERRTPRTMQYLFNVQRELPGQISLEVGYLGNFTRHLEGLRSVNEPIPGPGSVASRSPYPNFGIIQLVDNGSNASYNGLGVKLSRRYRSGLTYLFSYTWSRSIDDSSGIRTHDGDTLFPQNSYCRVCERAVSSFDTPQRFITSILYELPLGRGRAFNLRNRFAEAFAGGWQLGSIFSYQTGFPFTITESGDPTSVGQTFARPFATGVDPGDIERSAAQWFNTAAYRRHNPGEYVHGNVGRNTERGPNISSWDCSALKDFHLFGTDNPHNLQFRFEAFNLPNHPRLNNPVANIRAANFGTISGTRGNMRQLQLALKYIFSTATQAEQTPVCSGRR